MDISQCITLFNNQSVVAYGANLPQRRVLVEALVEHLKSKGYSVYVFSESIKSDEKYLRSARNLLPMVSPLKIPKEQMSLDQVDDVQLRWIDAKTKVAIVIPEFHPLAKSNALFFFKTLSSYLTRTFEISGGAFRFLVTLEHLPDDFFERLELYVGKNPEDRRSVATIARERIAVFRIPDDNEL